MNLLKHLRSNQFAIIVAILSVLVQSFHSFTAFYNTSSLQNGWGVAQAVLFSIVIDLAILFYTVRSRRDIAMYAAVAMVVINAYYYYQHLGITFEFIFGCFLSLIIPVSVYFYSEEIKDESGITAEDYRQEVLRLEKENENLKELHEISRKNNFERAELITKLKTDLDYTRQLLAAHNIEPSEVLNTEFNPDEIDDKAQKKEPLTISRTGGHKL